MNLDKISKSRMLLQNPYAHIEELGCFSAPVDKPITTKSLSKIYTSKKTLSNIQIKINHNYPNLKDMQNPYAFAPNSVIAYKKGNNLNTYKHHSKCQPEQVARNMQIKLWKNRNRGKLINPIDILNPSIVFDMIGYKFNEIPTLDNYSNNSDLKIAGMINTLNQEVYISHQFSPEVRRFTAAHELGHALMHKGAGLHRDKATDGSKIGKKERIEKEADEFAVHFLMPKKLVIKYFLQIFGTDSFSLNNDIAFSLSPKNMVNIMKNKDNIDFISRTLAKTESYNNQHFISLSKQFKVSIETMAIRIKELKLINI